MKNLAEDSGCDVQIIKEELTEAGISMIDVPRGRTEVPYSVIGKLGNAEFHRGWYYWMVSCRIPLSVAEEMYEDEVGKRDVRVAGHCGCPPPAEWEENGFITSYHIDTQEGLNLFAQTIREHNLL